MLYEIILLLRMSICNTDFSMHGEKKSIIIRQLVINWQEDPEDDYQMSESALTLDDHVVQDHATMHHLRHLPYFYEQLLVHPISLAKILTIIC
jgi:hypothetical protein